LHSPTELLGRAVVEGLMGSMVIVIDPPGFDEHARLREGRGGTSGDRTGNEIPPRNGAPWASNLGIVVPETAR
jgi:hypothetical protein